MTEVEKQLMVMAEAITELPEEKKQFFLGYAEGVAAMAAQVKHAPALTNGTPAAS